LLKRKKREKRELPLAPLERLLKKCGAKRVSENGVKEFASVLYEYAYSLSAEAVALAEHAGRKTVLESDIRMARRKEKF